jgi:hypothetical protein
MMAIVGFEFTKINVKRQEVAQGKINISNTVGIVDIKRNDIVAGKNTQNGIKFVFDYKSLYEPNFAKIELEGTILYLTDEKNAKEILDSWEKDKRVSKDIAEKIINTILTRCNIQSIILSNTVNLPPPVPMPKVNIAAGPAQPAGQAAKPAEKPAEKAPKAEKKDKQESLKK